ncbi:hypothetical protein [Desulforhopalus sp. 52FAK]
MTETNDNTDPSFPRSRVKKQSNRVLYLFIITIAFLTGGFYFYQKNLQSIQEGSVAGNDIVVNNKDLNETTNSDNTSSPADNRSSQTDNSRAIRHGGEQVILNGVSGTSSSTTTTNLAIPPVTNEDSQNVSLSQDNATNSEEDSSTDETYISAIYAEQIEKLNGFYEHLDSQQYMQDFNLPQPSKAHFSKLIQKLIDNPPTVTRETDDLFTLLKNTAHFFRIIGKDNILVLKGILDREKDSFESILKSFYTLTNKPELLTEQYSIVLAQDSLYDYACFFINTMGGRLYLFRRDSNSRMVVSFYAISIIDRANDAGNSRHGIDIRPGIDSLIEEIENGGKNLKMREFYLDTLYDLKVKYN